MFDDFSLGNRQQVPTPTMLQQQMLQQQHHQKQQSQQQPPQQAQHKGNYILKLKSIDAYKIRPQYLKRKHVQQKV